MGEILIWFFVVCNEIGQAQNERFTNLKQRLLTKIQVVSVRAEIFSRTNRKQQKEMCKKKNQNLVTKNFLIKILQTPNQSDLHKIFKTYLKNQMKFQWKIRWGLFRIFLEFLFFFM